MGGFSSKDMKMDRIRRLSGGKLSDQDLEEIMMNTQFNEAELLKLYEKFRFLDRSKTGLMTNREFLSLEEL
jgi:Ca2+-binding EF-hand superfamily protein